MTPDEQKSFILVQNAEFVVKFSEYLEANRIPPSPHSAEGHAGEHRERKAQAERDGRRTAVGLGGRWRP